LEKSILKHWLTGEEMRGENCILKEKIERLRVSKERRKKLKRKSINLKQD